MSSDPASDDVPVASVRASKTPVILTFGLKPERFLGFEGRIDAVLEPPAQDDADVLVRAIAYGHPAHRRRHHRRPVRLGHRRPHRHQGQEQIDKIASGEGG